MAGAVVAVELWPGDGDGAAGDDRVKGKETSIGPTRPRPTAPAPRAHPRRSPELG